MTNLTPLRCGSVLTDDPPPSPCLSDAWGSASSPLLNFMVKKFEREAAAVAADGLDGRRRLLTAKEMHRTLNHRQTERGPRPTRVDGRRSSIGGVQCGVCGRTSIKNLFAGGEIVEFILREREKIVAGEECNNGAEFTTERPRRAREV